ncbi:MAG: amino acid adenylation domain-containing protein [Thermodesulfobacteriota bacterium]
MSATSMCFPLTHAENRIYFTQKMYPRSSMWNVPSSLRLTMADADILAQAARFVFQNTPGLQVRFTEQEGEACKYLDPEFEPGIERLDFRSQGEEAYLAWAEEQSQIPRPMLDAPPFRVAVADAGNGIAFFYSNFHHIAVDGGSNTLVHRLVHDAYTALQAGRQPEVPEHPDIGLALEAEKEYFNSAQCALDKEYWHSVFETLPEPLDLAGRADSGSLRLETLTQKLRPKTQKSLLEFCTREKVSPFRVVLAALGIVLSRTLRREDLVLGTATANRHPRELHDAVGMFVSTVGLRLQVDPEASFTDMVGLASQTIRQAVAHERYPYDALTNDLRSRTGEARDLIACTLVEVVQKPLPDNAQYLIHSWGESLISLAVFFRYPHQDSPAGTPMELFFAFNQELFETWRMEQLGDHIQNVIRRGIQAPDTPVSELDILDADERDRIVNQFNHNPGDWETETTVQACIQAQTRRFPGHSAVVYRGKSLTYTELEARANSLARSLQARGAGPDTVVGLLADRCLEVIVSQLGILKSGAAFMPIDPEYPQSRIRFMLEDIQAPIILTQPRFMQELDFGPTTVLNMDDPELFAPDASPLENQSQDHNLCTVIYTSGSTGQPKGVLLEHHSLVNIIQATIRDQGMTPKDRIAKHASFSFDASLLEVFTALMSGAQLHVIPEEIRLSLSHLNEYFQAQGITWTLLTTQLGEQFMEFMDNSSLRILCVGGEKLRTFKPRNYQLINCYGPTECAIYVTSHKILKWKENIPIGRPAANCRISILDKHDHPQPAGAPGELCISGPCVGRGYHNRPEKTAASFVQDPFAPGSIMYRTGDLAAWNPQGEVLHLGRMDRQVKMRGFRIELGEIENAMLLLDGLSQAAVKDFTDSAGHVFLCAYFAGAEDLHADTVRDHLQKQVPDFMVPAHILSLPNLPVNPSGKIDRDKLPRPAEQDDAKEKYVAPETETEKALTEIWAQVLESNNPGAQADFFQNGGDSLRAVALQLTISRDLGREVELSAVFEHPTPRALAQFLDSEESSGLDVIPPAPAAETYPATLSQQQLFLLHRMQGIGTAYNMPLYLTLHGPLDKARLSEGLRTLVQRHQALRTAFEFHNGRCVQRIADNAFLKLDFEQSQSTDPQKFAKGFVRPFDLENPPLMRTKLVSQDSDMHWLFLDFHHIVCDGISVGILLQELMDLYAGKELDPLPIQHKDFAAWEAGRLEESRRRHEEFWTDLFASPPEGELPTDWPRSNQTTFAGDLYHHLLDPELTQSLRALARQYGATLHQVFLSGLAALLGRWADREDICLGTSMSGRERSETAHVVGMFVRTLPTRLAPTQDKSFARLLSETRQQMQSIQEHAEYPISSLFEKLGLNRGPGRHPLFDVNFVMRNTGLKASFQAGDIRAELDYLPTHTAKFDLSFAAQEHGHSLALEVDFRTDLYERDTVARMVGHLLRILSAAAKDPEQLLCEISMLGPEERSTLLTKFNPRPTPAPAWPTVCQAITDRAAEHPDHAAVVAENAYLTYRELDSLANRAARAIIASGGGRSEDGRDRVGRPDQPIVAVMADRTTWPVVGMLAALKAGAAYVGLDVNYPQERQAFILEDTQAPCLLGTAEQLEDMDFSGAKIALDRDLPETDTDPGLARGGQDLAYVIFTSGSTGKPKGVLVEHHSMVNFIDWYAAHHCMTPDSACAAFAAFSFDVSVVQIFAPLVSGSALHVIPEQLRRSPQDLDAYFVRNQVTHAHFPTQFAEQFMRMCPGKSLKYMVVGGDRLKSFRLGDFRLTNEYGPSETTMACLSFDLPREMDNPPVGSPVANTRVYILDSHDRLCPLGVPGEICVAGSGVARGYLNRQELTAERFGPDPFVPGEPMFRTGDLGRWRDDGNVDFIGRMDFQVKIRGFRVEPGEIELRIKDTGLVQDCLVVALEEPGGNKALAAYCVSHSDLDVDRLKQELKKVLPEYMLPSYTVQLDKLPLNPNGKVDRGRLPRPEISGSRSGPLAPRNAKERHIAQAWATVLGHEGFGLFDSFFEVGGDSLKAIALLAELSETYDLSASDIFAQTSIAEQAEHFQEAEIGRSARLLKLKELAASGAADEAVQAEEDQYAQARTRDSDLDTQSLISLEHVLLTGATGTLGVYLLRQILEETPAHITALIRAKDDQAAARRLNKHYQERFGLDLNREGGARLQVFSGDLSRPDLGLDPQRLQTLEDEVDAIVHSAALTSHYGDWKTFEAANIHSTANLADFALRGRAKTMHHISTTSVAHGRVPNRSQVLFTEFDLDLGQEPGNLYARSKLEAEKLLQGRQNQGLQMNIYRAGNITSDSQTGRFQKNVEDNAFFQQLRAYVNLGAAPERMDTRNMTYVDQAAQAIVTLMHRPGLTGQTFHIQNPGQLSLSRALDSRDLGLRFSPLPFDRFVEFMAKHAGHAGFADYVERLLVHLGWQDWLSDPDQTAALIRVEWTADVLRRCGFVWKEPEPGDLRQFVDRALEDRMELFRAIPYFQDLDEHTIRNLSAKVRPEFYEAERLLQQENQAVEELGFIMEGMVETYRHNASGWVGTVRVDGPGAYVGMEAVSREAPAMHSVESLGDVFALQVSPQDLRTLIMQHPGLSLGLLRTVTDKVNQAERLFVAV